MADKEAPPRSTASGGDRISALPDCVRENVLSFLPAHEAVRTAVVSRSWRDLWMRSPALRITRWGSIKKFNLFVERLLRLHSSAPVSVRHPCSNPCAAPMLLDSCHFDFGTPDFVDEIESTAIYEKMANYWFHCALHCQVRVLQYCFSRCGNPLDLLDMTLVSRHVTKLELAGVSTGSNINLSGCPVLLDLKMKDCYLHLEEIQSPYLQHLSMANCCLLLMHHRTLIHLPSIISLELTECSGRAPFLDSMPSLAIAIVTFDSDNWYDSCDLSSIDVCDSDDCEGCDYYYSDPNTDRTNCLLLNGLSEATILELSAYPETVVFRRDLKFARAFGKLKTLILADWFVADDLSALIWFLHHSPILEKLTLHISKVVHENAMTAEQSCKLPEPSVTSSHLKIVEIKCHQVDGIVIEILKILTSHGVPAEQINIKCSTESGYVNFKCTGFSTK